jgi:hypothetical protein
MNGHGKVTIQRIFGVLVSNLMLPKLIHKIQDGLSCTV